MTCLKTMPWIIICPLPITAGQILLPPLLFASSPLPQIITVSKLKQLRCFSISPFIFPVLSDIENSFCFTMQHFLRSPWQSLVQLEVEDNSFFFNP